ncbi:MAG: MarR family winged helix-turn-helix transcriptional regulator [Collinsella sp.]|nr:MarR family winged helix-turn-helix transcriptional regulator [Collinsella sp.]
MDEQVKSAAAEVAPEAAAAPLCGPHPELLLDNQLCFPLYAASRAITRRYTPLLRELDLTYTQYITMMALWERDGVTVNELGGRLYLDSGTLTPLLKKLEGRGLIIRARDEADERRVIVSLTDEGRDLRLRAASVPLAMMGCLDLDPADAQELKQLLGKVLAGLS